MIRPPPRSKLTYWSAGSYVKNPPPPAAGAGGRARAPRPPAALRQVKADLVAGVVASIEAGWDARRDRFVEQWMGREARRRIGAVREALLRKAPR